MNAKRISLSREVVSSSVIIRHSSFSARPLIGAHMSIAGGVDRAPLRGRELGCACMQIFTKSNRQWAARALAEEEIRAFKRNCKETRIAPVIGHTCYLINLGSADSEIAKKSLDCFLLELRRAEQLGLPGLVAHPGAHGGAGETAGLRKITKAINELIDRTPRAKVKILLETTAGQGTNLGYRFEHIAEIIAGVKKESRMAVCFDTCHAFTAGYDIRTEECYHRTFEEFDKIIGLNRLAAFHVNDSKTDLGSQVDRHEHIGHGKIGKAAFRFILLDSRFKEIPKILETPKGKKGKTEWDVINLRLLRRMQNAD